LGIVLKKGEKGRPKWAFPGPFPGGFPGPLRTARIPSMNTIAAVFAAIALAGPVSTGPTPSAPASPAAVSATAIQASAITQPSSTVASEAGPKFELPQPARTPQVVQLEGEVRTAQEKVAEASAALARRRTEVAVAETNLERERTLGQAAALKARKDPALDPLVKALEGKAAALKSMIDTDFPALKNVEGKLARAQATMDRNAYATLMQEQTGIRMGMMKKQYVAELAIAEAQGDSQRAGMIRQKMDETDRRIESIKQQQAPGNPPPALRMPGKPGTPPAGGAARPQPAPATSKPAPAPQKR